MSADHEILERYAVKEAIRVTFDRAMNPASNIKDFDTVRSKALNRFLNEHKLCGSCKGTGIMKVGNTYGRCILCGGKGVVEKNT